MQHSRLSEEQIIEIREEAVAGAASKDISLAAPGQAPSLQAPDS